jgi:dolichol-phosphate mannosyltransferase
VTATDGGVGPPGRSRVLVVIPTYNECDNVSLIVGRVRASVPHAEVLIADDASPDGTGAIADRLAGADDHVHVLHRPGKQGLGVAYLEAFQWGLDQGYDVLVEMDADGSHQPEELPRLLAAIADGADLVLGSRYVPGGGVVNWPRRREWLSRGGNTYARIALGMPLRDATGGYRAFRAETLRRLSLDDVSSQGYCFQLDLAWRALRAGMRVEEVPITFVERERGTSKMSGSIMAESLIRVTSWGVRRRLGRSGPRRDRGGGR